MTQPSEKVLIALAPVAVEAKPAKPDPVPSETVSMLIAASGGLVRVPRSVMINPPKCVCPETGDAVFTCSGGAPAPSELKR